MKTPCACTTSGAGKPKWKLYDLRFCVEKHREVFRADVAVRPLRLWDGVQTVRVEACMQELAHWLYDFGVATGSGHKG